MDHLQSLIPLIKAVSQLETFSVTRIVSPVAQLPYQHNKVYQAPLMALKALPDGFLSALFAHKSTLKTLELDFWTMSFERTKALLETCMQLQDLKLCFDAPFSRLVSQSPSSDPL